MIKYFTVLILSYSVQGEDIQTKFLIESASDCDRLIRVLVEPTRTVIPNADAYCIVTDEMSTKVMRPRARPEKENDSEK